MLREMALPELGGWLAFARISPIGDWRADYRIATVASLLANIHRDTKKRTKPFTPLDFMTFIDRDEGANRKGVEQRLLAAFGLNLDQSRIKAKGKGK